MIVHVHLPSRETPTKPWGPQIPFTPSHLSALACGGVATSPSLHREGHSFQHRERSWVSHRLDPRIPGFTVFRLGGFCSH